MFRLHALGAAAGQSASGATSDGPETKEGAKEGRGGTTSVTGNGRTTRGCKTAERRMGGHCAAPRARRHGERRLRHAPPHRVPLQSNPPTLGRTARCKLPHGSTSLTCDTSGQKTKGAIQIRGAPMADSGPRTWARLPRTGRRGHDASDAVLMVLRATSRGRAGARHGGRRERGSTVSRRAPPRQEPRAAPPGTSPSGRPQPGSG